VAEEAGTTVLSFGGPAVFKPSAWEWTFRAANLKKTDPAAARAILDDGLGSHPTSPSLHYELACWEAEHGDRVKALEHLRRAIEREPEVRQWMREDDDLSALREEPLFRELADG
jgi:hypothetical protein